MSQAYGNESYTADGESAWLNTHSFDYETLICLTISSMVRDLVGRFCALAQIFVISFFQIPLHGGYLAIGHTILLLEFVRDLHPVE